MLHYPSAPQIGVANRGRVANSWKSIDNINRIGVAAYPGRPSSSPSGSIEMPQMQDLIAVLEDYLQRLLADRIPAERTTR